MLQAALPALSSLGSLFGGGTRTSVSQSTNVSLAVNPIIANELGGGGITGSTSGNATGYPTSGANSSGNDGTPSSGYGYNYGGAYPTTGYSGVPVTTQTSSGDGAGMALLAGGAALLLLLFND